MAPSAYRHWRHMQGHSQGHYETIRAPQFMHRVLLPLDSTSEVSVLDAHQHFLLAARQFYALTVKWSAPARGVERIGREEVIRHLLRESGGMHDPDYTLLRRHANERQIIDEYAIRFVYAGEGIDNAPADKGDFVELKRVRILELSAGRVTQETCIENWTVLLPGHG